MESCVKRGILTKNSHTHQPLYGGSAERNKRIEKVRWCENERARARCILFGKPHRSSGIRQGQSHPSLSSSLTVSSLRFPSQRFSFASASLPPSLPKSQLRSPESLTAVGAGGMKPGCAAGCKPHWTCTVPVEGEAGRGGSEAARVISGRKTWLAGCNPPVAEGCAALVLADSKGSSPALE